MKIHTLLIEPDYVLANNYKVVLKRSGHCVTHVLNAQDAIHSMDRAVPDLIILELLLPNHNGIEFLYELRSYPEWQNIRIVILSFVRHESIATDILKEQLGIYDYIYKPELKLKQLPVIAKI